MTNMAAEMLRCKCWQARRRLLSSGCGRVYPNHFPVQERPAPGGFFVGLMQAKERSSEEKIGAPTHGLGGVAWDHEGRIGRDVA